MIERIYKPETVALIERVDRGSAHIIGQSNGAVQYLALTDARSMSTDHVDRFRGLLLDPASYSFARKGCIPRPSVSFRLDADDAYVSVTVGFACTGWIVQGPDERRGSFFDPVRDDVLTLVKDMFPEFASRSKRSVWRAGAIKQLMDAATISQA